MQLKYKIRKLLRPNSQQIVLLILKILLIITVAIIALYLAFDVYDNKGKDATSVKNEIISQIAKINLKPEKSANTLSNVNYTLITQKNIFGNLNSNQEKEKVKDEKPQSNSPLTLIGTFITSGADSYAIIENAKDKLQDTFGLNENVFEMGTLAGIYKNKVEINRNGVIEVLKIEDNDSESSEDELSGNIQYLDANEVQEAISNLPTVMTQARAIPYWQEGKAVGLRIFAIKKDSIFEKVGLKNGDILKNINGKQLGDFSKAMALFEELKNETSLSINLERNKKDMTLQYKIK